MKEEEIQNELISKMILLVHAGRFEKPASF